MTKQGIRTWAKGIRLETFSATASHSLCVVFQELVTQHNWNKIMVFAPLTGEPDIYQVAQVMSQTLGLVISIPRMNGSQRLEAVVVSPDTTLINGPFGVREPPPHFPCLEPNDVLKLDAIFVPGLCFDTSGTRLGFGGGWYDRFLSNIPKSTPKIGVCWSPFLVEALPIDPWDISMHGVITENGYRTRYTDHQDELNTHLK